MSNNFFSPNAKVNGGAVFASWNSKDGSVYLKLLKQIANNPDKKGNFDGANPIHIKLTQDEAADIIRTIRTDGESKFYHTFDDKVTTGSFKYYQIPPLKEGDRIRSGFGLTVKKTVNGQTTEVKIGFTLGSAERFSLFLKNALNHIFDAEYSEDMRKAKEYAANKAAVKQESNTNPVATSSQDPEPEADDAPPSF
jgi:hypothetical protein